MKCIYSYIIYLSMSLSLMAAQFTPPTGGGVDFLNTNLANEIRISYNERRQAIGQSPETVFAVGNDATLRAQWSDMHTWISNNVGDYVNYNIQPGGTTGITAFTWATFRDSLGWTNGGFRRAVNWNPSVDVWTNYNDGMFEYGPAQAGDIFGPWIYQDFQDALDALRWSQVTPSKNLYRRWSGATSPTGTNCTQVRQAAIDVFATNNWQSVGGPQAYMVRTYAASNSVPIWDWDNDRLFSELEFSVTNALSSSVECWAYFSDDFVGVSVDIDSIGLGTNRNEYYNIFDLPSQTTLLHTNVYGLFETTPIEAQPRTCANVGTLSGAQLKNYEGMEFQNPTGIIKWTFSYTNAP